MTLPKMQYLLLVKISVLCKEYHPLNSNEHTFKEVADRT